MSIDSTSLQRNDQRSRDVAPLFSPYRIHDTVIKNRIVMAPMGRLFNDRDGVPSPDYIEYFRRRAAGGTGLVISEGTMVPSPVASYAPDTAAFFGADALALWARVVEAVHAEGGLFMPQIWHGGLFRKPLQYLLPGEPVPINPHLKPLGPSGWHFPNVSMDNEVLPRVKVVDAMSDEEIADVISAFGEAAANAQRVGCDGINIHGAHGYLIDQFLWHRSNERSDRWGGDIGDRTRFAVEVIKECRQRTSPEFPIMMRYSQWKQSDYDAKLAATPQELERLLQPLAEAGVDIFDCSTRRIWEPEFEGSPLTLAAWTKKFTGKGVMAVGSVGLDKDLSPNETYNQMFKGEEADVGSNTSNAASLDRVMDMFEKGWFDLVAVGRALITDPAWARKIRDGRYQEVIPYTPAALTTLV